uniref:Growth differentiation factor 11 n=1 Tax=Latimeria chalumnae TaxID=7897 RepID=H3BHF4_LATCH
ARLLKVLVFKEFSGSDEPSLEQGPSEGGSSLVVEGEQGCPACMWREHSKVLRLETIKSQILSKLRLKQAPNISREVVNQLLPKAPPLQQLLDQHDFQGDSTLPEEFLEEDEYHATTETVITMASERNVCVCVHGCCCFCFFSLIINIQVHHLSL